MECWPAPGCLVQRLFAAWRSMAAALLLPCLPSSRVKTGDTVLQVKRRRSIQEAGSHTSQPCLVQNSPTTACGGKPTVRFPERDPECGH